MRTRVRLGRCEQSGLRESVRHSAIGCWSVVGIPYCRCNFSIAMWILPVAVLVYRHSWGKCKPIFSMQRTAENNIPTTLYLRVAPETSPAGEKRRCMLPSGVDTPLLASIPAQLVVPRLRYQTSPFLQWQKRIDHLRTCYQLSTLRPESTYGIGWIHFGHLLNRNLCVAREGPLRALSPRGTSTALH
jgi:hypothetical protein